MPTPIPTTQRASSGDGVLRAMVDQAVAEIVAEVLPKFVAVLAQVNLQAPQTHLTIPPAPITVNVPEADVPDVQVSVPGLVEFAAELRQANNLLGQIIGLMGKPVTKTVKRNANNQIEEVRETR